MEKKIASVEFLVLFSINNDISKASLCANDGIKQRDNKKAIHHVSCRKTYLTHWVSILFSSLFIEHVLQHVAVIIVSPSSSLRSRYSSTLCQNKVIPRIRTNMVMIFFVEANSWKTRYMGSNMLNNHGDRSKVRIHLFVATRRFFSTAAISPCGIIQRFFS